MSYELIISEKPQAAQKIAEALADDKPQKKRENDVNYFILKNNGKEVRVASAVGHLYVLGEKGGESWEYPVFETEWKPVYKVHKDSAYTKNYIKTLESLGKQADEVTLACDFDVEGEVIGLNVMRYALGKGDANRMKFSTLTKDELRRAYENKQKTIEWGQAKAGETRHHLDWFYGINLSRAFTESVKKGANQFKVLSTGRVQAPALHFLAEREKKISAFKPEPYWEIYLDGNSSGVDFKAQHKEDKISDKKRAEDIVERTTGKNGRITSIQAKQFKQAVPLPFDLTSLQMEASTMLGLTPKRTLEIAQNLYVNGYTSYPRTSSQQLPKELNLKKVLNDLRKQQGYAQKVDMVFKINPGINPKQGKKTDPAHPAIYPTGQVPKKLEGQDARLYDLIVKRFLAVFGKDAVRETNTVTIEIESEPFILKGTRTIEKNWHLLYEPYLKFEEVQLPKLEEGVEVKNNGIESLEKETSPPKRYTQASIIKELEKRNLGTKATRASILDNLYSRGYVIDKSIKVTELGLKMDEVIAGEIPVIAQEELTRHFEDEMELIREQKSTPEKVLKEAKDKLNEVLSDIKSKEESLGEKLAGASNIARIQQATICPCPECDEGTLMLKYSKKTKRKFVACNKYPDCKTIFNIPQVPHIKSLEENSVDENGKIWILAGKTEGRMQKVCINEKQPEESSEPTEKKYEEEGMTCPVCNEGKMKLRKSFYGEFLGCDNYPKCKTMMKITKDGVDTTPISPSAKKKTTKKKAPTKKKTASKK